jgi:hypothetical protein
VVSASDSCHRPGSWDGGRDQLLLGGGASLTGADDIAFLFAADAGLFVATSAGNPAPVGPSADQLPFLAHAVGASTQSRFFQALSSWEMGPIPVPDH